MNKFKTGDWIEALGEPSRFGPLLVIDEAKYEFGVRPLFKVRNRLNEEGWIDPMEFKLCPDQSAYADLATILLQMSKKEPLPTDRYRIPTQPGASSKYKSGLAQDLFDIICDHVWYGGDTTPEVLTQCEFDHVDAVVYELLSAIESTHRQINIEPLKETTYNPFILINGKKIELETSVRNLTYGVRKLTYDDIVWLANGKPGILYSISFSKASDNYKHEGTIAPGESIIVTDGTRIDCYHTGAA